MNNLRKAQSLYITKQQEYSKAREMASKSESEALHHSSSSGNLAAKMDKKKRAEDEALHKVGGVLKIYSRDLCKTIVTTNENPGY